MITKLLMIGCGDIAIRLANQLTHHSSYEKNKIKLYGVRRHIDLLPDTIQGISCDLNTIDNFNEALMTALDEDDTEKKGFDIVVITLVPNERSDEGYRQAYVDNLDRIVNALESQPKKPTQLFFVSSTSVYGQNNEEWVDEMSITAPDHFSGRRILQGEQRIARSNIPSTIIRFSGIYGPGRLRLIKQAQESDWKNKNNNEKINESGFSNRIHADDCAGVLAYFICQHLESKPLEDLYLATDNEPVRLAEIKEWIALQIGIKKTLNRKEINVNGNVADDRKKEAVYKRNSKRCSNKKLLESGYQFQYPTFREGYGELLKQEGLLKSDKTVS